MVGDVTSALQCQPEPHPTLNTRLSTPFNIPTPYIVSLSIFWAPLECTAIIDYPYFIITDKMGGR